MFQFIFNVPGGDVADCLLCFGFTVICEMERSFRMILEMGENLSRTDANDMVFIPNNGSAVAGSGRF